MHYFTQQSIELANQKDYLDQLFCVYPLSPDSIRSIDTTHWTNIERYYKENNNLELFKSLLELDLFPIKDGYVPYFKRDKTAIERNPATINRICGRIRDLTLTQLFEKCSQPKETNRQMGPLFRQWLEKGTLGIQPIDEENFIKEKGNAILRGPDTKLKEFAQKHLGFQRDKGIDFLARFNGKYIIGEAKFISDEGGHQNDQFLDALETIHTDTNKNVCSIGILDGVLYIPSKKKMYSTITKENLPIMSALLLREYLYSL